MVITVRPDKSVLVKAPLKSKFDEVEKKVQMRGHWVLKQINYFDKFHPIQPERQYVGGETHYYLGRQYRLRIRKKKDESIKLVGKFFIANTLKLNDREHIKFLMMEWYADHASMLLDYKASLYAKKILGADYGRVEIKYKYLKRRWGSYDPKNAITFNIELIKTPIQCIDYVIIHELCHLVHPNHDKAFYRLMQNIIPDWRNRKEKLELFGMK